MHKYRWFISDFSNNRIRKINLITNVITTFAGTGSTAYNGENNLALNTNINRPCSIRSDTSGNLYFSDPFNYRIRKITIATNIIRTVAVTNEL
jgi:hypothetical protein